MYSVMNCCSFAKNELLSNPNSKSKPESKDPQKYKRRISEFEFDLFI